MTFTTLNVPTDGVTDFGSSLAKHCNLAFCSFVLQIDWSKTFSDGTRNNMGVNALTSFICLWCNARIVAIGRKLRFHHTLPMTKQRSQFGCGYLQTAQEVKESLILNSNYSRTTVALLLKHANSIVFGTFVQ